MISPALMSALRNLAIKKAGGHVDWINIGDARALTDLGLAQRSREGWEITQLGSSMVKDESPSSEMPQAATGVLPFIRPVH